jgi:hypothetical protein
MFAVGLTLLWPIGVDVVVAGFDLAGATISLKVVLQGR